LFEKTQARIGQKVCHAQIAVHFVRHPDEWLEKVNASLTIGWHFLLFF
jgi:hypothetical protein